MKKIVFLTGTRADFGKLKSLIEIMTRTKGFEVHIFATGMHMSKEHGYTVKEIEKCDYKNLFTYINHDRESQMDITLSRTIEGFANYIRLVEPDLIVVHGDRIEALAGATVGALNNVLVAHIEGGEVSGTVDELTRHAVTKMSHIHFVSNPMAKKRLIQMGELAGNIYVIGSPDVDVMLSADLPTLESVKAHYDINFDEFSVVLFHPVTTEIEFTQAYAKEFVDAIIESGRQHLVIYPNNDLGSSIIINEYKRLEDNQNFRIFPSIRFENFLVLLKNAKYIIGNSSAGIREAPYYGLPAINIGTRQQNRALHPEIINCGHDKDEILDAIKIALKQKNQAHTELFGAGNSSQLFQECLLSSRFWGVSKQKQFVDLSVTKVKEHEGE
jgi:UDP-N-acetylglucosamine 2-epimerase (hydrolysing)